MVQIKAYRTRFTQRNIESLKKNFIKSYFENGLRRDGRSFEEPRSLSRFFAKTETILQAKGSSYLELNRTKVVCSVFEPKTILHHNDFKQLGEVYVEVKFTPFSCPRKRRKYCLDEEKKELSAAFEKSPRACCM